MAHSAFANRLGDPRTPVYPLCDVARYLGFSPQRTRHWLEWIPGRSRAPGVGSAASFLGLVSMLVMKALREYGVKPRRIRSAERYLVEHLGEYPLARSTIWTDGEHVLFNRRSPLSTALPREKLEAADMRGQQAFVQLLKDCSRRIDFDVEDGLARAWFPRERVKLDPRIQFGEPCVPETRIRTSVLYSMHLAGDSVTTLVRSYGISRHDVTEALEWEKALLARTA